MFFKRHSHVISLRCVLKDAACPTFSLGVIVGKARQANIGQKTTKYGQDLCVFDRISGPSRFYIMHYEYATMTSTVTVSEKRCCWSYPPSHSPEGNEATSINGACGLTCNNFDQGCFYTWYWRVRYRTAGIGGLLVLLYLMHHSQRP